MIFILVIAIIIFACCLLYNLEECNEISCVVCLILLIASFVGAVIIITNKPIVEIKKNEVPIAALVDKTEMSGNYSSGVFVGRGSLKSELRYYYMENTEKGKKICNIPITNVYIKETNTVSPKLVTEYEECYNWFWTIYVRDDAVYTFYVPEGTIDMGYEINIQ